MVPDRILGASPSKILFIVAIGGLLFYALGPILFPETPNLRQPELLPVYTLMLGLGQLAKGNDDKKDEKT